METRLIKIGNSFGVRVPKSMIPQYALSNPIELDATKNGVLIKSKKKARAGWEEQLTAAIAEGQKPDDELLEGFIDEDNGN